MGFKQQKLCLLLLTLSIADCSERKVHAGNYSATNVSLNLSRTGDDILSGQWKSATKPMHGTLTSNHSLFGESFQIYIPECKKDLPVEITQSSENLQVEIKSLPACEVEPQSYSLQLNK